MGQISHYEIHVFLYFRLATVIGTQLLQHPYPKITVLSFLLYCMKSLANSWQEIRDHSFKQNISRSFRFTALCWCFSSLVHLTHFHSYGKSLILCSVIHLCVDFDICFGSLSWWKIQTWSIIRFLTEAVGFSFVNLLVFERIHDAMYLNKTSRTSSRKTSPQNYRSKLTWWVFWRKSIFFYVSSDHRSQCHLKLK